MAAAAPAHTAPAAPAHAVADVTAPAATTAPAAFSTTTAFSTTASNPAATARISDTAAPITALEVHALFLRYYVKGDGLCRDYAELCCLRKLEHGSQDGEQPPTYRDREAVCALRKDKVAWMRNQPPAWQKEYLRDYEGSAIVDLEARFVPSEAYVSGAFTGLDGGVYGNCLTAMAMSAVRSVDIVSIDESKLSMTHLPLFSQGKEYVNTAATIWRRVQNPTSTPLIVVFFNGACEANGAPSLAGHFAAGVYRGCEGEPIVPPVATAADCAATAAASHIDATDHPACTCCRLLPPHPLSTPLLTQHSEPPSRSLPYPAPTPI